MAEQKDLGKGVLISGIAAGIIALGGGYFMVPTAPVSKEFKVEKAASTSIKKSAVDSSSIVARLLNREQHKVKDCDPATGKATQEEGKQLRVSPLFTTPELWQVTVTAGEAKTNKVIDILDPNAAQIHPGIENSWFLKYGLKDALCVSNGPDLDPDEDGFSNAEERRAETNPTSKADAPKLHGTDYIKLATVSKKTTNAYIQLDQYNADSKDLKFNNDVDAVTIKIFAKKDDTQPIKSLTKEALKPGDTFGISEKEPQRFKLVEIKCGGNDAHITVLDTVAPKQEEKAGFAISPEKKNRKRIQDTWVTLKPTAGPKKGEAFEVLVGTEFSLPGDENTKCELKAFNDNGSSQIFIKGGKSEVTAPKEEITATKQPEKN